MPHHHKSKDIKLVKSYPWECVNSKNVKVWKFLLINRYPESFDNAQLKTIKHVVEKYISTYFFPSYRIKASITLHELLSSQDFEAMGLPGTVSQMPAKLNPHNYIPIYLVDEFDPSVPSGFGTSVHGGTNDSVLNGVNPLVYINGNDQFSIFYPLAPGFPWAVIAKGSNESGNGAVAEASANSASGEGPTDVYDVIAHALASNIIEIMGNPGGLMYIANGDTLGLELKPGQKPYENFYLKSMCAPFANGNDNIMQFMDYSMPNFALPCYFHPAVDILSAAKTGKATAVYDILGNGCAPLTPYKGTQFIMRQEAIDDAQPPTLSDMFTATLISDISDPRTITYVAGGSIYDYESWGFQLVDGWLLPNIVNNNTDEEDNLYRPTGRLQHLANRLKVPTKENKKIMLKVVPKNNIHGRRVPLKGIKKSVVTNKSSKSPSKSFDPKKPQLLPFQYVNCKGYLVQRYAVINYSPVRVPKEIVDQCIEAIVKGNELYYLPHWNNTIEVKNYTIHKQSDVPKFDGTFIPLIITVPDLYNTNTAAMGFLGGGASNLNNVPDAFAGPTVDFYFQATPEFSVPALPRGCPFLACSDLNFKGDCQVTTNVPGLGPFRAGTASYEPSNFPLPFTSKGVVGTPDNTCCTAPTGTTNGNPLVGNVLIFGNNPPCQTSGPQRYTNVDNSGCKASIAIRRFASTTPPFPSNLGLPYVSEPSQYMVGLTLADGTALINESAINPNLEITIGVPHYPAPESIAVLSEILCHETSELNGDPNYATYIAAGDPPSDKAILLCQREAGDPSEALHGAFVKSSNGTQFPLEPEPRPAYFIPNLKFESYDHNSLCPNPLIPFARQQCIGHYKSVDNSNAAIYGPQLVSLESSVPGAELSITSFIGQNHFNKQNFFPAVPGDPSTFGPEFLYPPDDEVSTTPFASVVDNLRHNNDVFYFKYGGVLFPGL